MNGEPDYEAYLRSFRYVYLNDDHCFEKLAFYKRTDIDEILNQAPIIVRKLDSFYQIIDGVHRASAALYHKKNTVKCVEFLN